MKLQIEKHNTADNRGQKYLSAENTKKATIGYESIKTSIKDKGEYYVQVEWNKRGELTNYGFYDLSFDVFVE